MWSHHDLQGISLWQTYTLSSPCLHFLRTSLSTSLPCLLDPCWPRARGLSLSVANNHTLSPHLASVVVCCPCLFHTRTHTFFTHSFYFTHTHTHSLVRDSLTSISIWMFWKVKPQKSLTRYMWRKTFTSGMIIRFITTCTYFILSFIFGIVDISNFFINLVKISKVWLKKNVGTTLSNEGVALSLSLLSLTGLPSHSNSLYRRIIRSLCQRIALYIV